MVESIESRYSYQIQWGKKESAGYTMKNLHGHFPKKLKNIRREKETDDAMRQIVANAKKLKEQIGVRNFGSSVISPLIKSNSPANLVIHFSFSLKLNGNADV